MSRLPLMLLLLPAIGCSSEPAAPAVSVPFTPQSTASSGTISTPLGRATFADPQGETFKVKRITGDWHVEVKAKPGFDLAVQEIDFAPGFIQVVTGEMTFYEADDPDCEPIVRSAGQGILDVGEHAHIARNETTESAKNLVVYLVPPGAPALRFDAPDPGYCPFTN